MAGPFWSTFQHHLALFLAECAKFEGHLDVSMIKEEGPVGGWLRDPGHGWGAVLEASCPKLLAGLALSIVLSRSCGPY